ncbi:MAG: MFS transporter [Gammaproteobacteria bacterium]|jgi:predicted MFS family arabinose efflux permease|nr:MFS transporter [Gammaproteobacteria bacterium]|tara:strand:+ start:2188 stop:3387 length:1200 start_codon:yes stop_codon:yes gene_type:complete
MANTNTLKDLANPFDDWRSISIAIFMALVGYTVMVSVPVLSTALVQKVGFTEEQVGHIWGADLGGLSIGAIISAMLVARINRRYLVFIGVGLSIGANALCMFFTDYEMVLALRILAGVGSGIFTAVAVVTLGGTTNPTTAYNLELVGFAFSTALELNYLPQLTMNEIYLFFMILSGLCAALVFWIPARPLSKKELAEQEKHQTIHEDWHVPKFMPWLCLAAVCFTYINIGGYFTYIELAALADGVSQEWTGSVLTWSSFLGIAGCLIAYVCTRYGLFKPLFVSLITMAAIVAMLALGINDINLAVSLFGFMTLWTFVDVYQSSMVAHMDRSGSLVALLPSVQGFGQFVGPNIAASIVGAGLGYPIMFVVSGSMALVALVLYMGVSLYMHRQKPVLAEAT